MLLALPILLVAMLAPRQTHRPLDPDEPIAADGSLTAGRALTIFDFEPVLGAFDPPYPPSDSDDPKNFEERIQLEKTWTDRSREEIAKLLGPLDASIVRGRQPQAPDRRRAHLLRRSRPAEIQLLAARPARQSRHRARMVDSARSAHR